jgi:AAA+ ATPase superfamily predicted ATPase
LLSFPYNPAKWTSNPYDREELKSELLDALEASRAFILVGARRIGKTSLLKYVEAKAHDKKLLVSYVNLQESWERSPSAESFVEYYTTSLLDDFLGAAGLRQAVKYGFLRKIEWLKEHIKSVKSVAVKDFVTVAFDWKEGKEKASTLVRSALDLPEAMAEDTGKRAIVLVDEFQEITLFKQAIPNIHGLLRTRWSDHDNTSYITTGSAVGILRSLTTDEDSVFKEFFIDRKVEPFDFDTSGRFVRFVFETVGLKWDPAIEQFVLEKTAGIPKWLVRITYDAYVKCRARNSRVTDLVIERVWEDMYSFRSGSYVGADYDRDLQRISFGNTMVKRRLRSVLSAMATIRSPIGPSELLSTLQSRQVRIAKNVLFEYLDKLVVHGLVNKAEGGIYSIVDPILGEWLRRTLA